MIRSWWRDRRRRRWLSRPFPRRWKEILNRNVAYLAILDQEETRTLERLMQVFIPERYWEGCQGLEITDEIKVTIAGQACLLLLGFEGEYFDRLPSILVYPDTYVAEEKTVGPAGVVTQSDSPRYGEAWHRGPVVLSWTNTLAGGKTPDDGENLVLHEFAHHLDMQGRIIEDEALRQLFPNVKTWLDALMMEFRQFQRDARHGRAVLLSDYAATNEKEFFAVATEVFFEQPVAMVQYHPRLYDVLRGFYRQNPVERIQRS